jgi:AraC family transcriptional regulator, arabinose operon regulatory protein
MDRRVVSVSILMKSRLRSQVKLADLALAANISPSRLCHLFRAEGQTSPSKHLKLLRLKAASKLLENSFLSIKEIMTTVGIKDKSHFTKDFKKNFGLPPREYRRQHNLSSGVGDRH